MQQENGIPKIKMRSNRFIRQRPLYNFIRDSETQWTAVNCFQYCSNLLQEVKIIQLLPVQNNDVHKEKNMQ